MKKRLIKSTLLIFILINLICGFHAYKFSHTDELDTTLPNPMKINWAYKLKTLIIGVSVHKTPSSIPVDFEKLTFKNNDFEAMIKYHPNAIGNICFFHGYGGNKTQMLSFANYIYQLGFNIILTDFRGHGNSLGHQTTIGYKEKEEVLFTFNYIKTKNELPIYLFGSSLGAAAIMHSISSNETKPAGIILECPYSTLLQTTKNRFANMKVPLPILPNLLVFWGGALNSFNGFALNPEEYAKNIHCPTLLMWGKHDENVKEFETISIFKNIASKQKQLIVMPNSGHFNYLRTDSALWSNAIIGFLCK